MLKKRPFRFCAAVAALTWITVLFSCAPDQKASREASLDAVPVGSMMMARISDPASFAGDIEASQYLSAFDSLELRKALDNGIRMMRELGGNGILKRPMTIAGSKVGAKSISLLFVSKTGKDSPKNAFGADTLVNSDRYEKTDIVTVKVPSGTYSYYTTGGYLVLSDNRLYLEQSILQQAGGVSLESDPSFVKSYPILLSGKKATVALRFPEIADHAVKNLGIDPGIVGELAPWAALEIRTDSTTLRGEGLFCTGDSTAALASVLAGQKVKNITLDAYIPSDAVQYTYLGISDWNTYFSDYTRYLKASSQFHLYNNAAQKYNKLFGGDFRSFFLPWAGTGLAVIHTAGSTEETIVIGVKDSDAAAKALEKIADSSVVRPDPYKGHAIVPIGQKTIFRDLVTRAAGKEGVSFGAVVDGVAVFAPSLEGLRKTIEDILSGTTLTSILPYAEQKNLLATNTNMLVLVRGDLWSAQITELAKEKRRLGKPLTAVEKYVRDNASKFKNLRYNFLQVSATSGTAFLNIRLSWDDSAPRQAVKEWSYALESAPATTPMAFPNHRNGRYDVLIQDAAGTIYLISDKGSLFWKKKLGAPITSPIVVCDLYDNKRYQMAFWTGNKFHVIDRLGNYVTTAEKVARAKKITPDKPKAVVASTNEISYLKAGSMRKIKTEHSPLSAVVYVAADDALVYRISDGKVYGINPSGEKLQGFPVQAEKDFTAEDFGRDGRLGIVTTSPEGVVTLYRMPKPAKK